MTKSPTAQGVYLVTVAEARLFEGEPIKRIVMVAVGLAKDAPDRALEHLGRPDGWTAELSPSRLSEEDVQLIGVRPGDVRELDRAFL